MTIKSFYAKVMGHPVNRKADESVLYGCNIPYHAPIEWAEECVDELHEAEKFEEAVAIVMAYVRPKVEGKGSAGDPVKAIRWLDSTVPERRSEIQLVARYFGLFRGGKSAPPAALVAVSAGSWA